METFLKTFGKYYITMGLNKHKNFLVFLYFFIINYCFGQVALHLNLKNKTYIFVFKGLATVKKIKMNFSFFFTTKG